jgi:hypothetical protein
MARRHIYKVFPTTSEFDDEVVVSTRGLRRVVIMPEGEIVQELQPIWLAKAYCDGYNGLRMRNGKLEPIPGAVRRRKRAGKTWAQIQTYSEIARR